MSRIDEAFKRASGVAIEAAEPAARAARPRQVQDTVLHDYPQESGIRQIRPVGPAPLPRPSVAVEPAVRRRRLVALPPEFAGKLVLSERAAPLAVEQYRRLAGTMHEIQLERGLKTLMVTSSIPHEGKTLTVSNLALTLSASYGRQVLLIDADLRRPTVHEVFRMGNERGLGDVLQSGGGDVPFRQISDNLTVLPAGRADQPMEGLTSDAMRTLLERCAATYDWVLLDAPPVGMMPDARLLAGLTRAVLFVIAARSTPHQVVSRALSEFDPDSVVGTVLNRVEERDIPSTGYYMDYYSSPRLSERSTASAGAGDVLGQTDD